MYINQIGHLDLVYIENLLENIVTLPNVHLLKNCIRIKIRLPISNKQQSMSNFK